MADLFTATVRALLDALPDPVILLDAGRGVARGEEADKIRSLDSGADDDITKPFSPAELSARVGAILWRAKPGGAEQRFE